MDKRTLQTALAVTFWTVLGAGSAMAGGRACVNGPAVMLNSGQVMPSCHAPGRVEVRAPVYQVKEARELRNGVFCRYPHRPSDSVFSGGSGYIIKDDVRRANGCR